MFQKYFKLISGLFQEGAKNVFREPQWFLKVLLIVSKESFEGVLGKFSICFYGVSGKPDCFR